MKNGDPLKRVQRVGIVGARGIGNYGGFETLVAELAPRLSKRGFGVYCSSERGAEAPIIGEPDVHVVAFPLSIPSRYYLRHLFEFLYDLYFCFYFSFKLNCEVVYVLGTAINILSCIPRAHGGRSIVNMAGTEWKRSKFSSLQRRLLKLSFFLCLVGAHVVVIDNQFLSHYVPKRFQRKTALIAYGASEPTPRAWGPRLSAKRELPVSPNRYWLMIARLQPDNNIDWAIQAYLSSNSALPLVIVGDYSGPPKYRKSIERALDSVPNGKTVITVGGIYDRALLDMLREHAFGYIHPHSIGGTNPSLLEAMIAKSAIIANDNPFNREVGRGSMLYFNSPDQLAKHMDLIEANPESRHALTLAAYREAKTRFSWDEVVNEYLGLFNGLLEAT